MELLCWLLAVVGLALVISVVWLVAWLVIAGACRLWEKYL